MTMWFYFKKVKCYLKNISVNFQQNLMWVWYYLTTILLVARIKKCIFCIIDKFCFHKEQFDLKAHKYWTETSYFRAVIYIICHLWIWINVKVSFIKEIYIEASPIVGNFISPLKRESTCYCISIPSISFEEELKKKSFWNLILCLPCKLGPHNVHE